MSTSLDDVENAISELERHASQIRQIRIAKPSPTIVTYLNDPAWRSLTHLPGLYYALLANLELVLLDICHRLDQTKAVQHFTQTLLTEEEGYWSRGAIAKGAFDLAVKAGVLDEKEQDRLARRHSWDEGSFQINQVVAELDQEIPFLRELLGRLRQHAQRLAAG